MTPTKDMVDEALRIELAGLRGWKKTTRCTPRKSSVASSRS
jgi:hypothetical protein